MSADEDLLHCAVCLFSGTAVQVITHQWWHHSDIGARSSVSQLREDLAAAQTARLATERERDGVREELARMAAENEDLRATLAMRTGQLLSARTEIDHLRAELHEACAHTQPPNCKES